MYSERHPCAALRLEQKYAVIDPLKGSQALPVLIIGSPTTIYMKQIKQYLNIL